MRRAVQVFIHLGDPHCLCSDGTVWRRLQTGFGEDGRGFPEKTWWQLQDLSFPPVPEHHPDVCDRERLHRT